MSKEGHPVSTMWKSKSQNNVYIRPLLLNNNEQNKDELLFPLEGEIPFVNLYEKRTSSFPVWVYRKI